MADAVYTEVRVCAKCGKEKALGAFSVGSSRGRRQISCWCKECVCAYKREWFSKKMLESSFREKHRLLNAKNYVNNRQARLLHIKQRNDTLRDEILSAYGNKCACCGERESIFLALDHVKNDGALHRRSLNGKSQAVYRDVKRRGFPKDAFQLLCHNCNWAKKLLGYCVHSLQLEKVG